MQERYGRTLHPSWIWAQLAHETGNFTSRLAVEDHNYGGIKATGDAKTAGISPEGDYYRHFDSDEEFAQYAASMMHAPSGSLRRHSSTAATSVRRSNPTRRH